MTLGPDDPLILGFSGDEAIRRGDIDKAVSIWRRVVAKDLLSPTSRGNLAGMLLANGQLDEALAENRKVFELHPDAGPKDKVEAVRILMLLGRYDEAQSAVAQLPKGEHQDYGLALLHRVPARRAEANAALKRLEAEDGDFGTEFRAAHHNTKDPRSCQRHAALFALVLSEGIAPFAVPETAAQRPARVRIGGKA